MSYTVSIGKESFNYTWNLASFFYDAIPGEEGSPQREKGGIGAIDGMPGKEALHVLGNAFERIERMRIALSSSDQPGEKEMCAKYDAPNGWGSVIGAMSFLARIMVACVNNPDEIVEVY